MLSAATIGSFNAKLSYAPGLFGADETEETGTESGHDTFGGGSDDSSEDSANADAIGVGTNFDVRA
jgi:hypothetical protein